MKVFSKCICHCHCLCLSICLCHCLFVGQFMSPYHSDQISQRSQVSRDRSLKVLSKCICLCHCLCLCICLCHCLFVGRVISPHHSDQMSQRSQVSRVTLLLCFQKVSQSVSESVTRSPIELSAGQLKRHCPNAPTPF